MKILPGKEEEWATRVEVNSQDPYSKACVDYAIRWAELMEAKIEAGDQLEAIAKDTGHEADTERITVFMYGCAVSMLALAWVHGERLRRWHNLDCQVGNEGERANEEGDVLNPALVNINVKEPE